VLEFARRTAGLVMPLIAVAFIAYCFVGPWAARHAYHDGFASRTVVVELFSNNGCSAPCAGLRHLHHHVRHLRGLPAGLQGGRYFNDLALRPGRPLPRRPAKVTVISGILFGAISG
jgi:TRAP-type uncharacterized transport system fused permease subunit